MPNNFIPEILNSMKLIHAADPDWVYWLGAEREVLYCSPAGQKITGLSSEEFLKNPSAVLPLISPEYRTVWIDQFNPAVKPVFPEATEIRLLNAQNETISLRLRCQPLHDASGKPVGCLIRCRDVSDESKARNELNQSIGLFRELIESSPIPTAIYIDFRVHFYNQAALNLLGAASFEEIKGKHILDLSHPDSRQLIEERMEKFASGEKLLPMEQQSVTLDGRELIVLVNSTEVIFDGRKALMTQFVDLTEFKKTEKALRESESRFQNLFENSPNAILISDSLSLEIIDCNRQACLMNGYERSELVGKNLNLLLPEDQTIDLEVPAHRLGEVEALLQKTMVIETKHRRKDGTIFPVETSFSVTRLNNRLVTIGIDLDITERKRTQHQLEEAEERLRRVFHTIPDAINMARLSDGVYLDVNDSFCQLSGYSREEIIGKNSDELNLWAEASEKDRFVEILRQKGMIQDMEARFRTKDGRFGLALINARIMQLEQQQVVLVITRDISAYHRAEQERESLHQLVQRLFQASNLRDCSLILADELYRVFQYDSYSLDLIDHEKQMLIGIYNSDTFEAEQRPQETATRSHHLAEVKNQNVLKGEPLLINRLHSPEQSEYNAFGNEARLSLSLMFVPIRHENQTMGIISVQSYRLNKFQKAHLDLLQIFADQAGGAILRLQAVSALVKSEENNRRLATLVEQTSESIMVFNPLGDTVYVNQAFERLTGFLREDIVPAGLNFQELLASEEMIRKDISRIVKAGQLWQGTILHRRKDGTSYQEEAIIFPIRSTEGDLINFCKIGRDISHEQELEQQLRQVQKMEAIGTLAGGIAHDFNNLLTIINGYAEMAIMKMDKDISQHKEFFSILKAGKRAQQLTSQLLAFSRKQIFKPEILNINKVIGSMDEFLRRLIGEDIVMIFEPEEILPSIKADQSQIEQIFTNLIVNARDAVQMVDQPNYRKQITIKTGFALLEKNMFGHEAEEEDGPHIIFSITDNGIGMPADVKNKIFEPFFTTKPKDKGTGLGLSMVYGIVRQNHGRIYVDSAPGLGTTFRIYWPATIDKKTKDVPVSEDEHLNGTETILLVEDEAEVLNFAGSALAMYGYQVYQASNGNEALSLIHTRHLEIDLLVTDLVMPEMNGRELAARLSLQKPGLKIIFVSGYADGTVIRDGSLEQGTHFLQKPYSVKGLLREIRQTLSQGSDIHQSRTSD